MRNRSRSRSRSRDRSRSGSRDRYRGRHGRSEGQVRAPGGDRDGPRNGNWDRDRDLSDRRNFDHRGVPRGGGSRGRGGREGRRSWRDEHEPNRNADRLKEQSKDIGRETAAVCPAPLPEEVAPPPAESSDEDLADLEWNVGADEEDSLKLEEDRRARKERLAALAARARLENEAARAEAEKAAALDDDDDEIEGEDFNGNDHGTMDIIKEGAPQILPALGLDQQQGENGVASSTVNITGGDLGPGKALEVGGVFDMFSDSPNALPGKPSAAGGSVLMVDEGDNPTLQANWTDQEGYYKARVGEVIEGRYKVLGVIGQGVFSVVLKCLDSSENGTEVALKMIRNNDTMRKAAQKEVALLKEIAEKDPHKKKHCVLLLKHLEHRNHTVMVFESLQMNLRETLKKFGRKVGINITAVRSYAKQLFIALKHLAALQIIHADIKPDNILVSQGFGCLKLADFGSAFKETDPDCEPTPYLVSRWYRAPEVVLGLEYDRAIDMWSVAVTLYELYTGVSMFPGRNNNEMLFMMMEYKGAFPNRIIKQHLRQFEKIPGIRPHFADDLRFMLQEPDPVTGQPKVRMVAITAPTKTLKQALLQGNSGSDSREAVIQLADLLEKCLLLDPRRRMTVTDALQHPFLKME